MAGVRELAERDLFPGGSRRNYEAYRDDVEWGGLAEMDRMMLCDAQTSGGLLVAIPADGSDRFQASIAGAVRIGAINGSGAIRVRP
jgi:selenide,water dikinase